MSDHRITTDLPCFGIDRPGSFKADLDYTYTPGATPDDGPELVLTKLSPVETGIYRWHTHRELTVTAEEWLTGDGYEMAKEHAERQRGAEWTDWEGE